MLSLSNYEVAIFREIQSYMEKYYVPEGETCKNKHTFLCNREKEIDPFYDTIFVHHRIDWNKTEYRKPENKFCEFIRAYFNDDFEKLSCCCKKASLTKGAINKIWEKEFWPTKEAKCKIVIAAGMDFESAMQLFRSLGICFYNDNKFDVIMMFCFEKGVFDLCTINKMLYLLDVPMLCYGVI